MSCCVKECKHGFADCILVGYPEKHIHASIWQTQVKASDPLYVRTSSHRICLCHFTSRQFVRLMPYDVTNTLKDDAYPDRFAVQKIHRRNIPVPNQPKMILPSRAPVIPVGMTYPCKLPSTSQTIGFLIPVQTIGGKIQLPAQNQGSETNAQISVPVMDNGPLLPQNLTSIAPAQSVQQQKQIKPSNAPELLSPSSVAPTILCGLKAAFSKIIPQPIQSLKECNFHSVFIKEEGLEIIDDTEMLTEKIEGMNQTNVAEPGSTDNDALHGVLDMDVDQVQDSKTLILEFCEMPPSLPKKSVKSPAKKSVKSISSAKKSQKSISPAKKSVKSVLSAKKSVKYISPAKKSVKSISSAKKSVSSPLSTQLSDSLLLDHSESTPAKLAPKILGGLRKAFSKLKPPEPDADFLPLAMKDETMEVFNDDDLIHDHNKVCQPVRAIELCRLCANSETSDNDMIPIMGAIGEQMQIQQKIIQHLPIAFSAEESRLPMQVCTRCLNELNVCHELILRCTIADEKLNNLIQLEDRQLGSPIPCTDDLFETLVQEQGEVITEELVENQKSVSEAYSNGNDTESDSDSCNQMDFDEHVSNIETTLLPLDSNILKTKNLNLKGIKQCPFVRCASFADSLKNLKNHIYKIHKKEMCTLCEKIFDTNNELVEHVEETHAKTEKCKVCGKKVPSGIFIDHLKLHARKPRQNYECHICSKSGFRKKLDLEIHMSRHQTEKKEECSVCGKKFFHIIDVKKHHRASHRNDLLKKCAECNSLFKTKNGLTAHMFMRHLVEWKYLCNLCEYEHKDLKEFYSHIKENHNDAVTTTVIDEKLFTRTSDYKCETCNNAYPNAVCLKKHKYICSPEMNAKKKFKVRYFTKPRMRKCQFCNDVFFGPKSLNRHLRIDHNITEDMSDNELKCIGTRKGDCYECNLCHKKLASKITLQTHFRFHTKEKIYKCDQCDESFYLGEHLDYHENQKHKFITPYHCSKCPKQYAGRHLLYRHMKSHTKPKVCQYCGKTFALGGQLRTHELIHTGVKPHVCKICNRGFTQKHEMESHQLAHLNEKKFKCSNCNYKSNKRQDVVKHMEETYATTDNLVVIRQDLSTLM